MFQIVFIKWNCLEIQTKKFWNSSELQIYEGIENFKSKFINWRKNEQIYKQINNFTNKSIN